MCVCVCVCVNKTIFIILNGTVIGIHLSFNWDTMSITLNKMSDFTDIFPKIVRRLAFISKHSIIKNVLIYSIAFSIVAIAFSIVILKCSNKNLIHMNIVIRYMCRLLMNNEFYKTTIIMI